MPAKMLEAAVWESLAGIVSRSHQDTMPLPKKGGGAPPPLLVCDFQPPDQDCERQFEARISFDVI